MNDVSAVVIIAAEQAETFSTLGVTANGREALSAAIIVNAR
jgi:hypothetical protein